jgi:uncharacterized membrane protein
MYLLIISGIVLIAAGICLIAAGILQCRRKMAAEAEYLPADAEVTAINKKYTVHLWHFIPIIGREYSPQLLFRTEEGMDVKTALPYCKSMSSVYKDCLYAFENGNTIPIRYDQYSPQTCYYGSQRGFRLREAAYKFVAASIIILIGIVLIYFHFHI